MTAWMMPRTRAATLAAMAPLAKAKHAAVRVSAAVVLARSAAVALDEDCGMPVVRNRLRTALDELESIEHFLNCIANLK